MVVCSECLLHCYKLSVPRSNGLVKVSNVVFGFVTQRSFVISNGCVWTLAPPWPITVRHSQRPHTHLTIPFSAKTALLAEALRGDKTLPSTVLPVVFKMLIKTDSGPLALNRALTQRYEMGSCALIGFGNTERTFRDGLMVVKEDNGVDAEIHLLILQVFTLIWLPSVNNPIRQVKMWWWEGGNCYGGKSSTANHFWYSFQMLVCLVCWAALTRDQELQQNSFLEMGGISTVLRPVFSQQCTNQLKTIKHIQIGRASGNARNLRSILFLLLPAETINNNSKKDWKRLSGCPHQKEAQNSYITVHNVFLVKVLVSILV